MAKNNSFNFAPDLELSTVFMDKNENLHKFLQRLPEEAREDKALLKLLTPIVIDSTSLQELKKYFQESFKKLKKIWTPYCFRYSYNVFYKSFNVTYSPQFFLEYDLQVFKSLTHIPFKLEVINDTFERRPKLIQSLEEVKYRMETIDKGWHRLIQARVQDKIVSWEIKEAVEHPGKISI